MNRTDIDWKGYLDRSKAGEVLNEKKIVHTFGPKNETDYFIISSVTLESEKFVAKG